MKTTKHRISAVTPAAPILLTLAACAALANQSSAATVSLGTADPFAVLGGSTITNTGSSVITGDLGLSPGTSITGFPPGTVNGTIHATNGVASQAQADARAAYVDMAGRAPTQDLTGQDLGGLTLTPGVYSFSTSAQLTGTLTLDGQGLADPVFIFQIGSSLTTATNSSILGINSAESCDIFFIMGSSATLGTDTDFKGTLIASESVTLDTRASVDGRVIALNGAVTLDNNVIDASHCVIPEPASAALGAIGVLLCCLRRNRRNG